MSPMTNRKKKSRSHRNRLVIGLECDRVRLRNENKSRWYSTVYSAMNAGQSAAIITKVSCGKDFMWYDDGNWKLLESTEDLISWIKFQGLCWEIDWAILDDDKIPSYGHIIAVWSPRVVSTQFQTQKDGLHAHWIQLMNMPTLSMSSNKPKWTKLMRVSLMEMGQSSTILMIMHLYSDFYFHPIEKLENLDPSLIPQVVCRDYYTHAPISFKLLTGRVCCLSSKWKALTKFVTDRHKCRWSLTFDLENTDVLNVLSGEFDKEAGIEDDLCNENTYNCPRKPLSIHAYFTVFRSE